MNHEGTKFTKGARSEAVARAVVNAGLKVHRQLGPGLLESAYEHCLARELELRGLGVARQVGLPITYEDQRLEVGYRLDLIVDGRVIVEVRPLTLWRRSTKRSFSPTSACQVCGSAS